MPVISKDVLDVAHQQLPAVGVERSGRPGIQIGEVHRRVVRIDRPVPFSYFVFS